MSNNGHWPMNEGPAQNERTPDDFSDQVARTREWFPWELEAAE